MAIRITISDDAIDSLNNIEETLKAEIATIADDLRLEMLGYLPNDGTPFRVLEVKPKKKS